MIKLRKEDCLKCGLCEQACAFGAVEWEDGYPVLTQACVACGSCVKACPAGALIQQSGESGTDRGDYSGFWVVGMEEDPEKLSKVSQELLSQARSLADRRGVKVTLAVFGSQVSEGWRSAAWRVGCDEILLLEGAGTYYCAQKYTQLLCQAIVHYRPETVLFPATADGRDWAPRVACRLQTGLTADCTGLDVDEDGNLMQIRPTYGGSIMATILTPDRRPQMASIRPNVMPIRPVQRQGEVKVTRFEMQEEQQSDNVERIASELKLSAFGNLDEASVILAGGYGLGGREGFEKLYRLCGKINATAAATRKAVDEGWAPPEIQVGQTGKTVAPDVYIALGISGALQHTLGMKNAKQIIAVNSDPAAPIFSISDTAILADAGQVLDQLLQMF